MYDVGASAAQPANSVTRGGAAWWKVELEEGLASSHLGVVRIGTVRSDFGSTILSCPSILGGDARGKDAVFYTSNQLPIKHPSC